MAISNPVYAAQVAIYKAYMESSIPGNPDHPALFAAINKDTQELWFELVPFDGGLARHEYLAVVLDEYGGTAGLVTLNDLVSRIVGELSDNAESTA